MLIGQKMDLLGLAETWLLPGEGVRVKGYKWVGAAREGRVGRGGVGMLMRDSYRVDKVYELGSALASVWAKVSGKGVKETLVGVVYISPPIRGEKINGKGDQLVDLVLEAQQREMQVVVMVDFNAHL